MALATWWSSDPLPALPRLSGFEVSRTLDDSALAALNQIAVTEVQARRLRGHQPYVGMLDGRPVAYGWVATQEADIGELKLAFRLPPGNRYLWDFATLPGFQGWGIYPHLLQAILKQEASAAQRFWIIHAPENEPSGAGMEKAGLLPVGQLSFRPDGSVGLAPLGPRDRAQAGAELLGLSLIEAELAPCWHCGGLTRPGDLALETESCWPPALPKATPCTCAIKRKRPARTVSEEAVSGGPS